MSNYMFMLENHLTSAQSRALAAVQAAAAEAGLNLFLAGGAMRDMLGGFPIRDLDFVVEGNAVKLARAIAHAHQAELLSVDETTRDAELLFPGAVTAQIATSRQERYAKPGGKPQVTPADIHEHLRSRDFTVNAIALSLSPASRGLLLDPSNGLADLTARELRAVSNYTLYDQPIRLYRMIRLQVRLGFQIAERTRSQYQNAREAGMEKLVTPQALLNELRRAASEPNPGEVLQAWDREGLLAAISPCIAGDKLNVQGFQKLHKARQAVPFGTEILINDTPLFFWVLAEKLSTKDRASLLTRLHVKPEEAAEWTKLETRAKKLEKELASAQVQKPSHVYRALAKFPAEVAIFELMRGGQRVVQDRIRNYFQKYLPAALEVTDARVAESGAAPGTPKFEKAKSEMIAKRLDARPKRAPEVPVPAPAAPPTTRPRFSSSVR